MNNKVYGYNCPVCHCFTVSTGKTRKFLDKYNTVEDMYEEYACHNCGFNYLIKVKKGISKVKTIDFLKVFTEELEKQLIEDEVRWGDTWLQKPRAGQEDRIFKRFLQYYADYQNGIPIPWVKVAGNALIAWVREKYPEFFISYKR